MSRLILLALFAVLALPQSTLADVVVSYEFNTSDDVEGWTHNGSNQPPGPSQVFVAGTGEGVLQGFSLSGDLRVLQNTDTALPAGFDNWTTMAVRFRQLDSAGDPREFVDGTQPQHLFFGILDTNGGNDFATISTNIFTEETPGDSEFWMLGSLDISGAGNFDIGQIRFDPLQNSVGAGYQTDWVRLEATVVPEPTSLAVIAFGSVGILLRRRK